MLLKNCHCGGKRALKNLQKKEVSFVAGTGLHPINIIKYYLVIIFKLILYTGLYRGLIICDIK